MENVYEIVDSNGVVYNTIIWDGSSEYYPPEGYTIRKYVQPEIPEVAAPERIWTVVEFRNNLTLSEKVVWDTGTQPELVTVKQELTTPKTLAATQQLVDLLVDSSIISRESGNKIIQ